MFQSALEDIRQVADDLNTYLATETHHMARAEGILVVNECPPLPKMPAHIDASQRKKYG
jgi:hypothetical protein